MSIRLKLLLAFSAIVLLAAGVAGYGYQLISSTSAMVVKLYDGPLMAVNHARSAQLNFTEARRSVEKAIVLREAANEADFDQIEKSMGQFATDMNIVRERMAGAAGFNEGIHKILPLADEWYKAGMSYLKPPKPGVTQLPLPQVVIAKGNAVQEAMDSIVEYASAYGFNFRSEAENSAVKSERNLDFARRRCRGSGARLGGHDGSIFQPPDPQCHGDLGRNRQWQFLCADCDQTPRRARPTVSFTR